MSSRTPKTQNPVTSTPILRTTLIWSTAAAIVAAIAAAAIGVAVDGASGLWSGLIGVLIAVLFLAITALSILIANRWYGEPLYVQLFFAIVLGGWLLKLGIFVVLMIVLAGQSWISPLVFFFSLLAGVLLALAVDVVVLLRMRIPHVGEVELPQENPEDQVGTASEAGETRTQN